MFRIFEDKNVVNFSSWSVLSAYSFGQNLKKLHYIYRNYLVYIIGLVVVNLLVNCMSSSTLYNLTPSLGFS